MEKETEKISGKTSEKNGSGQLLRAIENPPEEFSPVPFWFFNDRPDEEKILHPRIGIPEDIPYLSDAYFQAVRFIVKSADSLGMKIVLYDEGMYPSGSAHGMVAAQNPEYASKGISLPISRRAGR